MTIALGHVASLKLMKAILGLHIQVCRRTTWLAGDEGMLYELPVKLSLDVGAVRATGAMEDC